MSSPIPGSSKDLDNGPSPPHLTRNGTQFMKRGGQVNKTVVKTPEIPNQAAPAAPPLYDPKAPDIQTIFKRTANWEASYDYLKQVKILAFTDGPPR